MEIKDSRTNFQSITFCNYKKSHVIKELVKSLYYQKLEEAFYWTADLLASGLIIDLWNIYIQFICKYIHINKAEDNLILRLKWIENQKDNGNYYYLNYLLLTYDSKKNNNEYNYINKKIKDLEIIHKQLEQNLKKENNIIKKNKKYSYYKFQPYIIKEDDEENNFKKLKDKIEKNSPVFYKNDIMLWDGDKIIEFKNIEDNTIALVDKELMIWKNNKWTKSDIKTNYDNIKLLCEFNNIKLKDLKLDSLDCIYRKDFGCQPKIYVRLQENIERINENINNFKLMIDYIKTDSFLNYINNNIQIIKNKYYSSIFNQSYKNKYNNYFQNNKEENNENKKINNKKNKPDKLDILVNIIFKLQNDSEKINFIYDIIEKDALIIDNKLYSKKYKKIINICSHYYFFKKIDYADDPNQKVKLIDKMLSIFSDNGESLSNMHTCKFCGNALLPTNYDETEGFSSSGMIKKSREVIVEEKVETKNGEEFDLIDYIDKISLTDNKPFKELLLKYGLSIEDIDEAIKILFFIVKNLFSKSGVSLNNNELINIVIDSMQKIKLIIPYSIYKIREIKKLQDKGFSKIAINKIENKNTFKTSYERYYKIKKNSIITSRFLISIQTSIEPIIRSSKTTICSFYSFDDNEGIDYMTCILTEMDTIILKDKTRSQEIIKIGLLEAYNDFKNMAYIKELFKKKK